VVDKKAFHHSGEPRRHSCFKDHPQKCESKEGSNTNQFSSRNKVQERKGKDELEGNQVNKRARRWPRETKMRSTYRKGGVKKGTTREIGLSGKKGEE